MAGPPGIEPRNLFAANEKIVQFSSCLKMAATLNTLIFSEAHAVSKICIFQYVLDFLSGEY